MATEKDVSDTIVAKSDQLNADDLLGGPITVTITSVKRTADDQPISIHISGGHQPFKPCKTMRRALVFAWGKDSTQWTGHTLVLLRDPKVRWGNEEVGGIRIQAMSHITARLELSLAVSKGKKAKVVIERLTAAPTSNTKPATTSEPTTVEKYAKRLAELKPEEIASAYEKFDALAPTMDDATAQQIYQLFAKYMPATT